MCAVNSMVAIATAVAVTCLFEQASRADVIINDVAANIDNPFTLPPTPNDFGTITTDSKTNFPMDVVIDASGATTSLSPHAGDIPVFLLGTFSLHAHFTLAADGSATVVDPSSATLTVTNGGSPDYYLSTYLIAASSSDFSTGTSLFTDPADAATNAPVIDLVFRGDGGTLLQSGQNIDVSINVNEAAFVGDPQITLGGSLDFTNTPAPSSGVPEPATLSLAAFGVLGLLVRRRKSH